MKNGTNQIDKSSPYYCPAPDEMLELLDEAQNKGKSVDEYMTALINNVLALAQIAESPYDAKKMEECLLLLGKKLKHVQHLQRRMNTIMEQLLRCVRHHQIDLVIELNVDELVGLTN